MNERRRRAIESVTEHFFFWQGLRWVPLGLALMAALFVPRHVIPSSGARLAFLCAVIAVGWIVSGAFARYYDRTYGHVHGTRHERRERWKWSFVYPMMLLALLVDAVWKGPIFVTGPVWGAGILLYRQSTGGGRLHYVVFALLLASIGFLPLAGVVRPGRELFNLFFGAIGAAYVLGGLLDHFEMTRILAPRVEDGDAGTV